MKLLVTGANGQLGQELKLLAEALPHEFVFVGRSEMDLSQLEQIEAYFDQHAQQPFDLVINGAAYTAVDKAESEPELATLVNGKAVEVIARKCAEQGAYLIQISTDYVFNGKQETAYLETDPTGPLGVYGKSKLLGEQNALKYNPQSVVVRTSWVYSRFGNNFLKTMMRLGRVKESLNVVADQIGSPTFAGDLAQALLEMAENLHRKEEKEGLETGDTVETDKIFQYTNDGQCSWFDFAAYIMQEMGSDCVVHPIPSSAYPTPAKRPAYSLLSTKKMKETFDVKCPYWKNSVKLCVDFLKNQ